MLDKSLPTILPVSLYDLFPHVKELQSRNLYKKPGDMEFWHSRKSDSCCIRHHSIKIFSYLKLPTGHMQRSTSLFRSGRIGNFRVTYFLIFQSNLLFSASTYCMWLNFAVRGQKRSECVHLQAFHACFLPWSTLPAKHDSSLSLGWYWTAFLSLPRRFFSTTVGTNITSLSGCEEKTRNPIPLPNT